VDSRVMEEKVFEVFGKAGYEIYLVGGVVRDRLMGANGAGGADPDLDFATSAEPGETRRLLDSIGLVTWDIGARFGTISALPHGKSHSPRVEVTTFRSEVYRERDRKPVVSFGQSLEEDLRRRDFTMNAIALDPDGRMVDPFEGCADIRAGIVRTPADPMVTMHEDPLRMLRAVRFAARFGFTLDPDLERAIGAEAAELDAVSRERWLQELDLILGTADGMQAAAGVSMLARTGLLPVVLPGLASLMGEVGRSQGPWHHLDPWEHTLLVIGNTPPELEVRWAALLHDAGKARCREAGEDGRPHFRGHDREGARIALETCEMLRFPKARRTAVERLVRMHMRPALYDPSWSDSAVRKLRVDAGPLVWKLMDLARADAASLAPEAAAVKLPLIAGLRARLQEPAAGVGRLLPRSLGKALAARNASEPGNVGRILEKLEGLVADGALPSSDDPMIYLDWLGSHPGFPDEDQSSETSS
jgi:poly(A) polymerase